MGEVFNANLKTNSFSREKLDSQGVGEIQNIHYGDILVKYDEILDSEQTIIPTLVDADYKCLERELLVEGDVIFADTAEDYTAGKAVELTNVNKRMLSGLHTIAIRPIKYFVSGYLGFYFNSPTFTGQVREVIQGTKVLSLNKKSLMKMYVRYPRENNEQEKIFNIFLGINNLITFHPCKLYIMRIDIN